MFGLYIILERGGREGKGDELYTIRFIYNLMANVINMEFVLRRIV